MKAYYYTRMGKATYRHVVADKVPVALIGVELDREATSVAQGLW